MNISEIMKNFKLTRVEVYKACDIMVIRVLGGSKRVYGNIGSFPRTIFATIRPRKMPALFFCAKLM